MRRTLLGSGLLLGLTVLLATGADAQSTEALATACVTAGGQAVPCVLATGAGRDLVGDVAALAGPGSEVPGESSTLGRRLGGVPRMAPWLGVGGLSVVVPDFADPAGAAHQSHFVPSLNAGLALGVFDGFQVLPTMGGLLSLDVVGQASFLFFSQNDLFDGQVKVLSLGARVGILQESFTLPGVSVSISRRLSGILRYGDAALGSSAQVEVDPAVTAVRATVGKDLFAFGVMAGVGWDDYSSDTSVSASDGAGGFVSASGSLDASRRSYFAGVSKQLGVLSWVSAQVGWFNGFAPVSVSGTSSQERGRSVYGSLTLLLKL
jgi:hypothetical protein